MTAFLFPPSTPSLPIAGSDLSFPVRRVYCVGRNYAAHAIEMGHDPDKEPPFFFQKNADDLDSSGEFPYPAMSQNVHHEIELVVALGSGGTDIAVSAGLDCVFGYAVGLDMTRRDLQDAAKDQRRPWTASKAFARSAPCSAVVPAKDVGHPDSGAITLRVNGQERQSGDLSQMIWKVPEVIAALSRLFTLDAGDVIMTGTPSGVAAIERGDRMLGEIAGIGTLEVLVV